MGPTRPLPRSDTPRNKDTQESISRSRVCYLRPQPWAGTYDVNETLLLIIAWGLAAFSIGLEIKIINSNPSPSVFRLCHHTHHTTH